MNRRAWLHDVFRPLAVGGMVGCIALSLVHLIQLLFPTWRGTFIVVGCIVAAVEANYSYRLIQSRRLRGSSVLQFRAVEIVLFLILLRVGAYVGDPWRDVVRELRTWPQDPLRILDLEVLYAFVLVLFSWAASTKTTYDLERIGEPPIQDKFYVRPVEALVGRFFWGGVLLLSTVGLTRIGISSLLDLSRPSVPGLIANVLVYFVLGLVMLGQIQFARLSHGWRKEGLEMPPVLASHWVRYTLILLGLSGLLAFLLPTAYTIPLLDVVSVVIQAILYAAHVVFYLVILAFVLLMTPLARLLGAELRRTPPDGISPPNIQGTPPSGSGPAWLSIVRSLAFWVVALGVVLYVLRSYLRDRPELMAALGRFRFLRNVRGRLRALWQALIRLFSAARQRMPAQLRVLRRLGEGGHSSRSERFRFIRLGALSRRERTLYYYLSLLRRAARHGYPRRPSQTPYEYDTDLGPKVQEVESELDRVTDAFVEVRYSKHEVDEAKERRVRADWKRVRAALRSLQRQRRRDTDKSSHEPE